jgi:hypothetical protein
MEGHLRPVTQGAVMQRTRLGPSFQSEVLEKCAARAYPRGASGKGFTPLPPLFTVEFFESGLSFVLLLLLAAVKQLQERLRRRIGRIREKRGLRNEYFVLLR